MPYIGAGIQRFNTADGLTVNGDAEVTGTVNPSGDTASGDAAAVGFTSTEGLILTGQGSTSDITVKNDADAVVFSVPTGTDDILFPDNAKAIFGAGSDLKIYHNGSSSFIEDAGTGNLTILANEFRLNNSGNTENMITAAPDGAVELYHDDTKRIETTSTGVEVGDSSGGQVTFRYTGNSGFGAIKTDSNSALSFSTGATSFTERLQIASDGTATFTISDAGTIIHRVGTNVAGVKTSSGDDFCVGTADYPQAIRIKNSNGAVGIGETAPDTAFDVFRAAGDVSQVQTGRTTDSNVGMIRFRDGDDNACGQITSNPSTNTTNYVTSSDYRLKENVIDMTGAITRVKTLSPKRFNFISNADVTVDGFLAHEAQAVVPEAVVGEHNEVDDDGNMVVQGIDLAKLVPLLTGALQEAIAKIETLETEMTALKARVTALEDA